MIAGLTNHLWQSTLFAAAAGLLTVAFRRNRAKVRYWLWFSASFKFFVPFALLMSLGSHLQFAPVRQIATRIPSPAVSLAMVQIAQPFPAAPAPPLTPNTLDWIPIATLALWACGFAAVALIRFRGWLRIRAAVRSSTPLDVPATVEIRSTPGLLEPGVIGFWRPILLLPAGIADRLTPPQLEAVLAHELSHIRRRDNLFAAIHMLAEALFWFHPLIWWIGARLVDERERACDEEVLSLGSEPHVYAAAILDVCKLYVESPLVCVSGVTGSNLKKRIEGIMTNRMLLKLNFSKKAVLAIAGIAALTVPIVIGLLNAPHVRAQSATALPNFDTVSIQPCAASLPTGGGRKTSGGLAVSPVTVDPKGNFLFPATSSPGSLNTNCQSVMRLIYAAYVLFANNGPNLPQPLSIEGGPAWINSDRYEIHGQAEVSPDMTMGTVMQALLADWFKLTVHRETRDVPVYALTVAAGGPKLQPFQGR